MVQGDGEHDSIDKMDTCFIYRFMRWKIGKQAQAVRAAPLGGIACFHSHCPLSTQTALIVQGTIAAAAVLNEIIAVIAAKKGFEWEEEIQG